ncbi:MAG: ScpA family protein [Minisyncoccia bacterium]|jgi:segregation and condensation protein A
MPYEIKTEQFSGPLEKLLELIEAEKLGVNEVSLAKVTDGFLKYLEKFRTGGGGEERFRVDMRILADFIAIASRLIFLKSKHLLPGLALTGEEEADIKDLEERLARYQALKPAIKHLRALWRENHRSYSRPYFLGRGGGFAAGQAVFYPGKNIDIAGLRSALEKIFETVTAYAFETETIKEKIISLEEKISEVLNRLRDEGNLQFRRLSSEKSRSEAIVVFLAILHLAREQLILLEQMENFSDIMVKKNERSSV